MKNVHLITKEQEGADVLHQYLYITSEEAIKEGDWYLIEFNGLKITQCNSVEELISIEGRDDCKKIILTTDPDLIASGIQPINDDFLEWFVKNPSCESVEVELRGLRYDDKLGYPDRFEIIIPQGEPKQELPQLGTKEFNDLASAYFGGEPKQETLEEANWKVLGTKKDTFYNGAKWQAERMYSEEEVFNLLCKMPNYFKMTIAQQPEAIKDWFEQFKKK